MGKQMMKMICVDNGLLLHEDVTIKKEELATLWTLSCRQDKDIQLSQQHPEVP